MHASDEETQVRGQTNKKKFKTRFQTKTPDDDGSAAAAEICPFHKPLHVLLPSARTHPPHCWWMDGTDRTDGDLTHPSPIGLLLLLQRR